MITCELIVEEIRPGFAQMAVIPKPTNATALEEKIFLQLQEVIAQKLEEIYGTAKAGGSIVGDLALEPVVRQKMEELRRGGSP